MLRLGETQHRVMVGHCLDGLPLEACGLLAGPWLDPSGKVEACYPCRNDAASAKLYTVNGQDFVRADRQAQERGWDIVGVFHSHTHTEPYPSPTDVAQAVDPAWHYVIVSLRDGAPRVRSYRIAGDTVAEEPVVLERR
jgi:[CysO sulfur-carrier protein]-S-L-cysteine hydrolase